MKDSYNGFTQSRYATLNSVMEACSETLINAGIRVTQYSVSVENKKMELLYFGIIMFIHYFYEDILKYLSLEKLLFIFYRYI